MASVLIPLADGVEEMEAVIMIDTLRRAQWDVISAGMAGGTITASRDVKLVPDTQWSELDPAIFDALLIPGGMGGTQALMDDERVLATIKDFVAQDKLVGAICAGPLVLQAAGILEGKTITSHPAVRDQLTVPTLSDDRVVIDGNLITSQAPGTAMEFALAVIALLDAQAAADKVAAGLVLS